MNPNIDQLEEAIKRLDHLKEVMGESFPKESDPWGQALRAAKSLLAAMELIEVMAEALAAIRFHTTETPKATAAKAWEKYQAFKEGKYE